MTILRPAWLENWRDEIPKLEVVSSGPIPDPVVFARTLPPSYRSALLGAHQSPRVGWSVDSRYSEPLSKCGLVECGGLGLTAFGFAVRKSLILMVS